MKVAEQLLAELEQKRGTYLSGVELANEMGVSRNAIWKAIQKLQEQGYPIYSDKQGYCLSKESSILSKQSILKYVTQDSLRFCVFDRVTSTNALLLACAEEKEEEGLVYVANEQTAGRGRRGRSFCSPADTGIYTSILLRPACSVKDALHITIAAAVAVCRTLEKHLQETMQIKWVNDIFYKGKKVCGILSEASLDMESGALQYVVLGIGINIATPQEAFADSKARGVAGSIVDEESIQKGVPLGDFRSKITADLWNIFWELYQRMPDESLYQEYKARMMWLGERIDLIDGTGKKTPATLLDLTEDFSLLVRMEQTGQEALVSSGEISIRRR